MEVVSTPRLRPGVRTGIGRYLLEILRAASRDGWSCVVYGDPGAQLDQTLAGAVREIGGLTLVQTDAASSWCR